MKGCGLQVARQLRRNRRFLSTSEEPSKNISSFEKARNLFESSAQVIVVAGTVFGGAYYLGGQHVSLIAELNSLKKEILVEAKVSAEKEHALAKVSDEKEQALAKVSAEKEQALAKVSAEKEQALKSILAEKEKTTLEKEQALAKVLAETDQALKSILAEKEKTQAAEKRELEARIRELESTIKNLKPSN